MGRSRPEGVIYHLLHFRYRRRILSSVLSSSPDNLPRRPEYLNPGSLSLMRADISGMTYEKFLPVPGRLLPPFRTDGSISSSTRKNRIPLIKAAMTTELPKESPSSKSSLRIKSNSLITGTFIVYVWELFHITRSSFCSPVSYPWEYN